MLRIISCFASFLLLAGAFAAQTPGKDHFGHPAYQAVSAPDFLTKAVILDETTIQVVWDSYDGKWSTIIKKFQVTGLPPKKIKALYAVKRIQAVNHVKRNGQACYATVAATLQFQLAGGEMFQYDVDDLGTCSRKPVFTTKYASAPPASHYALVPAPDFVITPPRRPQK